MTKFTGKVLRSDAHYDCNGGYEWEVGDLSIWEKHAVSHMKAGIAYRYINYEDHGAPDWKYSEELQELCIYLGIDDYSAEAAETLKRILKDSDLDKFTMKDFFGDKIYVYKDKPKPIIEILETPWAGIF